jgi:hypothetical protein
MATDRKIARFRSCGIKAIRKHRGSEVLVLDTGSFACDPAVPSQLIAKKRCPLRPRGRDG